MSGNQTQSGSNVDAGGGSGGSTRCNGSGGGGSAAGSSRGSLKQFMQLHQNTPPHLIAGITALYSSSANMAGDYSGDDSEDESEILEESPCGRWLKRPEIVDQLDVPGVESVHLAMDTEEGVEVVWNEVRYASITELESQQAKMRQLFNNIVQLDHENVIKFHTYWTDTQNPERPRVIFITEYVSSGSLKQFLMRIKHSGKRLPLESWRRWCTQILSALSYLHSCTPAIIHGHLSCESIFIQHNGIVKIGAVFGDVIRTRAVHQRHKDVPQTTTDDKTTADADDLPTAADDIYAFGVCALEMGALEVKNGFAEVCSANEEKILRIINNLGNELQRDFIFKCLRIKASDRPIAKQLLFHPILFEVPSLKFLSAHSLNYSSFSLLAETFIDIMMQKYNRPDVVMAYIQWTTSIEEDAAKHQQQNSEPNALTPEEQSAHQQQKRKVRKFTVKEYHLTDIPGADSLEKYVEDVRSGFYPLVAFGVKQPPRFRSRVTSPDRDNSALSASPEIEDIEYRRIVNLMCSVKKLNEGSSDIHMTLLFRMDDKMNRRLTTEVAENDTASELTQDLVRLGFVNVDDQEKVLSLLEETLRSTFSEGGAAFDEFGAPERTFSGKVNEKSIANNTTSNNNSSSNKNNSAKSIKSNPSLTSLNQMERNWAKADSDAAATTSSIIQKTQQQMSSTLSSSKPATASAVLCPTGTDPLSCPVIHSRANVEATNDTATSSPQSTTPTLSPTATTIPSTTAFTSTD